MGNKPVEFNAELVSADYSNDIALLKIKDSKFTGFKNIPYSFASSSSVGQKVFTIGYPLNNVMGGSEKVTDGILSSKSGLKDDTRYYQITVPLQPGNSGGPLFNLNGDIIGITTARLNDKYVGTKVENVNYAIKVKLLKEHYKREIGENLSSSQHRSSEIVSIVKATKGFVCKIDCN